MCSQWVWYLSILMILLGVELRLTENLETWDLNNVYTHNSFCTIHPRIHQAMLQMIDWNTSRTEPYRIVEIGAGNGLSTSVFQEHLRELEIPHTYTICEYDETYGKELAQYPGDLKLSRWEDLEGSEPFDLILTTVFSSVNQENTQILQKLLAPGGQIITVYLHFTQWLIGSYGYEIQKQKVMSMRYSVYQLTTAPTVD